MSGGGVRAGQRGEVSSSRGWGEVSSSRGWGEADCTQGDRIWSSLERQKVERGLLLIIHILCYIIMKIDMSMCVHKHEIHMEIDMKIEMNMKRTWTWKHSRGHSSMDEDMAAWTRM